MSMTPSGILSALREINVLVIGDLMLDHYVWGDVRRISPEAPAPVVHTVKDTHASDGAAKVAHHLAEKLVGRYSRDRRAIAGLCLNADPTAITCICNDYGYEHVFSRGVEALGKPGDVLVGFTTSGNSANVIRAFEATAKFGITTILLAGKDGGSARGTCDHEIIIPSQNTARIQEIHTLVLHQWLEAVDAHDWK